MKYLTTGLLLLATVLNGLIADPYLQDSEWLDMAFSAVDDQYLSCADRMMKNVTMKGGLLSTELMADGSYQQSWRLAERCNVTAEELSVYHKTALAFYMTGNYTFNAMFDIDTHALGPDASVYNRYYPYKSLHFLLTDAVRILGFKHSGPCRIVYSQSRLQWPQAKLRSEVRLGYFTVASTIRRSMHDLSIMTCYGIELPPSSCKSMWEDFLVPPFEKFKVVAVKKLPMRNTLYLESTGIYSTLSCAFYK